MTNTSFDALILIARPAAGKSEVIRYLRNTAPGQRQSRFHVAAIDEIDDFPMLWAWFEEDDVLARLGHPRLHTTSDGTFRWLYLWDVLIQRISLEYRKRQRDRGASAGGEGVTILFEFSRGKQHGGYRRAFRHLSPELLSRAAILYINVSYGESLRKNRRRFNPERPDSILEHGLSDEKMQQLYAGDDWPELTGGKSQGYLAVQGIQVPFVVFENEDDVTTPGGEALGQRLEGVLGVLWGLYETKK